MAYDPSLDNAAELLARAASGAASGSDLTQGGGGNVSVKTGAERMLIKATGSRLRDLAPRSGWTLVNYGNIRRRVASGPGGEDEFSDYVCAQALPVKGLRPAKPSIETGFHALLNTVVVHTHSVYANVLNMSAEGHALGRELFPGAEFIGYSAPGPQLCTAIAGRAAASEPQVFFLANHGLVTAHAGVEGALELNRKINETIRRGLSLPPYPSAWAGEGLSPRNAACLASRGRAFMLNNVLSPDQALYCGPGTLDGKCGPDGNEVLTALFYILDCMDLLKLTPKFLTPTEVEHLSSIKSGRYGRK